MTNPLPIPDEVWAHLRRDFQAMIDREGVGKRIGERLLERSHGLFHARHRVRDGTLDWETFQKQMTGLRREVRRALEAGSRCACAKTSATCFEILKVEEGLWTFTRVRGIEPTNNAAERALRFAVIWRRISGGTDRPCGSRFVERTLSVVYTVEWDGRFHLIENVPARVNLETGERLFAPGTGDQLQRMLHGDAKPIRMVETPVYQFVG